MLVSHSHKFIFTKTFKTAGTSIEHYFEPYCLPSHLLASGSKDQEVVSPAGIVGKRGAIGRRNQWYAHMPASQIRDQLGAEQWDSYTKFSIVRNPFDKMVSAYFFLLKLKEEQGTLASLKSRVKALVGRSSEVLPGSHTDHKTNFRNWIKAGAYFNDEAAYQIDGASILDYTLRYECLLEHLKEVCRLVKVPYEPQQLKTLKSNYRSKALSVVELYDEECMSIVNEKYKTVIDTFQYTFPKDA